MESGQNGVDDSTCGELLSSGGTHGLAVHVLGSAKGIAERCQCGFVTLVGHTLAARREAFYDHACDAVANKGCAGADADRGTTGQQDFFEGQRAVAVVYQVGTYLNRSINATT